MAYSNFHSDQPQQTCMKSMRDLEKQTMCHYAMRRGDVGSYSNERLVVHAECNESIPYLENSDVAVHAIDTSRQILVHLAHMLVNGSETRVDGTPNAVSHSESSKYD